MIDFNFNFNDIPDYAKAIGEAYNEVYEETHNIINNETTYN